MTSMTNLIGRSVIVDRCHTGTILAIMFRPGLTEYQVGWWFGGDFKSGWFEAYRCVIEQPVEQLP